MILYPAIDIKGGKVVRLKQGDYDQVTQYSEDPVAQAKKWAEGGAEWLHLVDLDAAKSGKPENKGIISEIIKGSTLKVQIGGGIRSLEMAGDYLKVGVSRIVVGTQAVRDPKFLAELGKKFPNRVALGLDAKEGKIAVQGWTQTTETKVEDFLAQSPLKGIACLIFTDIARDGMLTGPNLEALKKVAQSSLIPVIASGGISELSDLKAVAQLEDEGVTGVIVGKALYEGRFTVAEALECLDR